jgi:hypothetical protein
VSNIPFPSNQPPGVPPTTYANQVQLLTSPWDITLEFAQLAAVQTRTETPDGNVEMKASQVVQSVIRVVMSPQHAKAFSHVLEENLRVYEESSAPSPT